MMNRSATVLTSIWLTVIAFPMLASAAWIESSNGDLSGNFASPTFVPLTPNSSNTVAGTVTGAGGGVSTDIDYFTITVPVGQVLSALFVRPGTTSGGTGSFIGLYAGSTATNPATATGSQLLGYDLYKAADANTDILPTMATFLFGPITNKSQGFTPPLAAGNYTFWIQEGSLGTFNYNFDLVLSAAPAAVPLPAGLLPSLFLSAGVIAGAKRWLAPRSADAFAC
jgi:hypothetical protein